MRVNYRLQQLRALAAGSFARHVATLATGTLIANGFAALISPVLTRLYNPADIGRFGLYSSFIGVASVAATLRYDMAIVAAPNDRDAYYLALGSFVLAIPMSFALGLALYVLIWARILGYDALGLSVTLIVPFSLILSAAFLAVRQLLNREQRFPLVSAAVVWQSASRGIAQVSLGLFPFGWFGLLYGDIIGRFGAVARALAAPKNPSPPNGLLDWRLIIPVFRRYREYPTISFPSAFLNTLGINLPLPLIVHFFGADSGGQFALVQLVFALPLTLLGSGIGDVFYSRVAGYARLDKQSIREFFLKTTGILFCLGVVPFAFLAVFGPSVLAWIFGQKWQTAGVLAAVMTPWALSQLVVSPVSRIIFVVNGQLLKLYYDAATLAVVIGVLSFTSFIGLSLITSIAWLSLGQVVTYILYYLLILRAIDSFILKESGASP